MRSAGRDLRTLLSAGAVGGLSDGQLLDWFLARQEEAAFAELVRRHGPMVMGVCRRGLGNHHDAEDAFQATFLVLARSGAAVQPRERLAHWLHGVAWRIARKARATAGKRQAREKLVADLPEPAAPADDPWDDLVRVLDQELSRLPERYRAPVVLCDLEGQGRKQAAQQLGWPEGTLSSRLSRARALLADRLRRRGVALSGGALAALLSAKGASAAVPAAVVASTAKTATFFAVGSAATAGVASSQVLTLTERTLRAMLMSKLKAMTALLAVGVALLGAGAAGLAGQGESKEEAQASPKDRPDSFPSLLVEGPARFQSVNGEEVLEADSAVMNLEGRARLEFIKKGNGYIGRVVSEDKNSPPFEFSFDGSGVKLFHPARPEDPGSADLQKQLRELEAQRRELTRSLQDLKRKTRDFHSDPAVRHKAGLLQDVLDEIEQVKAARPEVPERREEDAASDKEVLHWTNWAKRLEQIHRQGDRTSLVWKFQDCQACHTPTAKNEPKLGQVEFTKRERNQVVRDVLVRQTLRDIKAALERLEQDIPDRQTELEALDQIEAAVRALKDKAKQRHD